MTLPIIQKIETAPQIQIGDELYTAAEAMQIAAQIVFLVDGNLIAQVINGRIYHWNTQSWFFQTYEMLFGK